MSAKTPARTRTKPVSPRRHGVGDCLLPMLSSLSVLASAVYLPLLLPAGYVVTFDPDWMLMAALLTGLMVAGFRIWDMGPIRNPARRKR